MHTSGTAAGSTPTGWCWPPTWPGCAPSWRTRPDLADPAWRDQVAGLRTAPPFLVQRLWLDRPVDAEPPGVPGHRRSRPARQHQRAGSLRPARPGTGPGAHGGSVIELHAYAAPADPDALGKRTRRAAARRCTRRPARRGSSPSRCCGARTARCSAWATSRRRPRVRHPVPRAGARGRRHPHRPAGGADGAGGQHRLARGQLPAGALGPGRPRRCTPCPTRGRLAPLRWLAARAPGQATRERGGDAPMTTPDAPGLSRPPVAAALAAAPAARGRTGRGSRPRYAGARPALIEAAVKRAQARPSGNWFVLGRQPPDPRGPPVRRHAWPATEVVAWRDTERTAGRRAGRLPAPGRAAGAGRGRLRRAGLPVARAAGRPRPRGGWRPLPVHDDGVLAWVRLDAAAVRSRWRRRWCPPGRPGAHQRGRRWLRSSGCASRRISWPTGSTPGTARGSTPTRSAGCPCCPRRARWTSAEEDDRFLVSVTFRVAPGLGVPVRAEFSCPGPRTVVMRITDGEGAGSVVETHATPRGRDAGRASRAPRSSRP